MHICISDDRRSGTVSPVQRPVKTGFFISLRFLNSNRVLSALQFRDMGRPGFPPRPVFNSSTASVQSSSFLLVKFPSMCPADDLVIQVHHQYDRNQNFQTESVNFITSTSKFLCLPVHGFRRLCRLSHESCKPILCFLRSSETPHKSNLPRHHIPFRFRQRFPSQLPIHPASNQQQPNHNHFTLLNNCIINCL